ncbi:hypothetical protein FGO68_gene13634 [Halteria grandinella]|uniref:Transmembrane protein n=1 Tax=Halteria grandinella TaxID=5974 RepID=A0A8J8T7V7_HALGN|nr:hypothetical protein FGO68_gene13634 [Halteria grandinella]
MNSKQAASPASATMTTVHPSGACAGVAAQAKQESTPRLPPQSSLKSDLMLLRQEALALARQAKEGFSSSFNHGATSESTAFTSTAAILSFSLTIFTLFALYTGLQNIPAATSQQQSLRSQTFMCMLIPICLIYFTKMALEDYIRTFYSFSPSNTTNDAQYGNSENGQQSNEFENQDEMEILKGILDPMMTQQQPFGFCGDDGKKQKQGKNNKVKVAGVGKCGGNHQGCNTATNASGKGTNVLFKDIKKGVEADNRATITQQKLNQLPQSNTGHSPIIDVDQYNTDEKGYVQPASPSGTDTTDDPAANQEPPNVSMKTQNFQNTQSMIDEKIAQLKKKRRHIFGLNKELFKKWFDFAKPQKRKDPKQVAKQRDDALPFNALELSLFAQNCLFQVFSDDKDNNRLEMLFSVAIMILLYFVVIQTFFQGRKSMSTKSNNQPFGAGNILDEVENQVFLNQFSEMYEMEFEKKRRQMLSDGDQEMPANHQQNQAAIHQAAKKVIRDLMIKHQRQQNYTSSISGGSGEKLFIVVLLQNLKRMGEAALRWSFFTLNMFILTLTICQSQHFSGCLPGQANCV